MGWAQSIAVHLLVDLEETPASGWDWEERVAVMVVLEILRQDSVAVVVGHTVQLKLVALVLRVVSWWNGIISSS
jgi:hypothetical protein